MLHDTWLMFLCLLVPMLGDMVVLRARYELKYKISKKFHAIWFVDLIDQTITFKHWTQWR